MHEQFSEARSIASLYIAALTLANETHRERPIDE